MGHDASTCMPNDSKSKRLYTAQTKTYKSGPESLRVENLQISEDTISSMSCGSETYGGSHKHASHEDASRIETSVPEQEESFREKKVSSYNPNKHKIRTTKLSFDTVTSNLKNPVMLKKGTSREFSSRSPSCNSECSDMKTTEYAKPSGPNLTTYERANFSAWESILRNQDHSHGKKTIKKITVDNHDPLDRLDERKPSKISSRSNSTTPRKNTTTSDFDESVSNLTVVSELSLIDGNSLALSHSAIYRESDSDTTSFLREALSDDSILKKQCFTCGPYTATSFGSTLPYPDVKKPADRLEFTSNFFSGSGVQAVEPAKKQKSTCQPQNYDADLPSMAEERVIKISDH